MEIRRAQNCDMADIMRLLYQVEMVHHNGRPDIFHNGGSKYTDEELREIIADDMRPIFVYIGDDGKLKGYAFCIFKQLLNDNIFTDIKTLYIDDICVDETCRGQKVGTALFEYVKKFAEDEDCYNVTLNVWSFNESAKKFYEKCGLVPQKVGMEIIL